MSSGTRLRYCFLLTLGTIGPLLVSTLAHADVFPRRGVSKSTGARDGIYLVLRDVGDSPLSASDVTRIRTSEEQTRRFYAENSGGKFDIAYDHILDVPLTLNADRTRPEGWFELAENYVRSNYGIEPEDFHLNVFDVERTTPDPNQGWSGIAIIPSNNIAVQPDVSSSWGQIVVDHELGHRIGAPHSGAYRAVNDNNYKPYVWDAAAGQYAVYNSDLHGHQAMPLGIHKDEYGNPFSVMGNISHEDFAISDKLHTYGWLNEDQVPELSELGEGTYRIYAHDTLESVYNDANDVYGVTETYQPDKLYGLTYTRRAERFNTSRGQFEQYNQELTIEYRAGRGGVQFYLDNAVIDLDLEGGSDRNNRERELESGKRVSDLDFATSVFYTNTEGEDFLSFNPPAPTDVWDLNDSYFDFRALRGYSDEFGSFIDLQVTALYRHPDGDYNDDGVVDAADYVVWRDNRRADPGTLPNDPNNVRIGTAQYQTWLDNYGATKFGGSATAAAAVPEPAAWALACLALIATRRRGRA
ncbi:hypothetical protein Pla123a_03250 [Posidoniimonas polymericola]|uniref:Uncharacterized protein n=1 Tax=Posidoniimonas polymericola TaxID=2528002 RepID=A0A5C5ZED3_9BACT|nr:hypothetical protein [Posidoniimonas polymericola]TWT85518.1 hypothetical protein Pla123a_03250 [Posidoniimonas polymericola]